MVLGVLIVMYHKAQEDLEDLSHQEDLEVLLDQLQSDLEIQAKTFRTADATAFGTETQTVFSRWFQMQKSCKL